MDDMKVFEADKLAKAQKYIEYEQVDDGWLKGWENYGHAAPSRVGLAIVLDISERTLVSWAKTWDDWRALVHRLDDLFKHDLLERAVAGQLPAAQAKFLFERLLGKEGDDPIPEAHETHTDPDKNPKTGANVIPIEDAYDKKVSGK